LLNGLQDVVCFVDQINDFARSLIGEYTAGQKVPVSIGKLRGLALQFHDFYGVAIRKVVTLVSCVLSKRFLCLWVVQRLTTGTLLSRDLLILCFPRAPKNGGGGIQWIVGIEVFCHQLARSKEGPEKDGEREQESRVL
jgi:hypothetical protein